MRLTHLINKLCAARFAQSMLVHADVDWWIKEGVETNWAFHVLLHHLEPIRQVIDASYSCHGVQCDGRPPFATLQAKTISVGLSR